MVKERLYGIWVESTNGLVLEIFTVDNIQGKGIPKRRKELQTLDPALHFQLFLFHFPASTRALAVPARSSYNLRRSSTDCFFRFNFFGVSILRSMPAGGCRDSKLGMRWSRPGLTARGFGPGTGKEVDLEGGRPVTGLTVLLG